MSSFKTSTTFGGGGGKKRIAIIGAGRSGLLTARHALQHGLAPTVFERAAEVGGLWSPSNTTIWHGLHANLTKHSMTLVDHPWPANTALFPSKHEINEYLRAYAHRFRLGPHILLRHQVTFISQFVDGRWRIDYLDLTSYKPRTDVFDFLCLASGMQSTPVMPPLAFRFFFFFFTIIQLVFCLHRLNKKQLFFFIL
jgi:dimethylaniline monooxygenase (N-oxide forming)